MESILKLMTRREKHNVRYAPVCTVCLQEICWSTALSLRFQSGMKCMRMSMSNACKNSLVSRKRVKAEEKNNWKMDCWPPRLTGACCIIRRIRIAVSWCAGRCGSWICFCDIYRSSNCVSPFCNALVASINENLALRLQRKHNLLKRP